MPEPQARRAARAALVLLDAQHAAEGVRLARQALGALREAAEPDHALAIDALLARPERRRDRDVSPSDVRAARLALSLVLEHGARAKEARRRVALVVAAIATVVVASYLAWPAPAVVAHASAVYAGLPGYGAAMVLDGDPETSWLLPDDSAGSISLVFREPRRVTTVRVRSTTNAPYDDRGTRDYVVQLALGGVVLAEEHGAFTWPGRASPNEHEFEAVEVDRVRVRVESWHREGGGIAEIEIE